MVRRQKQGKKDEKEMDRSADTLSPSCISNITTTDDVNIEAPTDKRQQVANRNNGNEAGTDNGAAVEANAKEDDGHLLLKGIFGVGFLAILIIAAVTVVVTVTTTTAKTATQGSVADPATTTTNDPLGAAGELLQQGAMDQDLPTCSDSADWKRGFVGLSVQGLPLLALEDQGTREQLEDLFRQLFNDLTGMCADPMARVLHKVTLSEWDTTTSGDILESIGITTTFWEGTIACLGCPDHEPLFAADAEARRLVDVDMEDFFSVFVGAFSMQVGAVVNNGTETNSTIAVVSGTTFAVDDVAQQDGTVDFEEVQPVMSVDEETIDEAIELIEKIEENGDTIHFVTNADNSDASGSSSQLGGGGGQFFDPSDWAVTVESISGQTVYFDTGLGQGGNDPNIKIKANDKCRSESPERNLIGYVYPTASVFAVNVDAHIAPGPGNSIGFTFTEGVKRNTDIYSENTDDNTATISFCLEIGFYDGTLLIDYEEAKIDFKVDLAQTVSVTVDEHEFEFAQDGGETATSETRASGSHEPFE